jgi:DNA-binding transcriptional ArsR family regulator
MLSLLAGAPFSAMELSRELGISHALASYHLRQLHTAGVIDLTEVRSHRGGRERRFTCTPAAASPGTARYDREGRILFAEAIAAELRRRSRHAEPGAGQVGVDAELWVDAAVWDSAVDAIRTASRELHEHARAPRTPGTVRVSVTALLFPMTTTGSAATDAQ